MIGKTSKEPDYTRTPKRKTSAISTFYLEHGYLIMLLVVIISWGVVPTFADLSGLTWDNVTFWVNITALPTVALLMLMTKQQRDLATFNGNGKVKMVMIGIAWPLLYSIAFFSTVEEAGAPFATILNATWPVFLLAMLYLKYKKNVLDKGSTLVVVLSVSAVVITIFWNEAFDITLSWVALVLGLTAAFLQALFSLVTDNKKYPTWGLTFIIELVTVVGITFVVLARGTLVIPTAKQMMFMAFIGIVSNGFGFAAFLEGNKLTSMDRTDGKGSYKKPIWLVGMGIVPFVQVIIAYWQGIEVNPASWYAIVFITTSMIIYRLAQNKK